MMDGWHGNSLDMWDRDDNYYRLAPPSLIFAPAATMT